MPGGAGAGRELFPADEVSDRDLTSIRTWSLVVDTLFKRMLF